MTKQEILKLQWSHDLSAMDTQNEEQEMDDQTPASMEP